MAALRTLLLIRGGGGRSIITKTITTSKTSAGEIHTPIEILWKRGSMRGGGNGREFGKRTGRMYAEKGWEMEMETCWTRTRRRRCGAVPCLATGMEQVCEGRHGCREYATTPSSSSPASVVVSNAAKMKGKEEEIDTNGTTKTRTEAVTAEESDVALLMRVAKKLWPTDCAESRMRISAALGLLVTSKVAQVQVPLLFKAAVDALSTAPPETAMIPVAVLAGYGAARLTASASVELRNAVFAKVAQRSVRRIALGVFEHLHSLGLEYHLRRQTGGLSRAIERGTRGINFILASLIFNIVPTALEVGLVASVLWASCGPAYAAASVSVIGAYTAFTFVCTQWRTAFRKQMILEENRAGTIAVDSFINYETVKYFNNEEHERERYGQCLEGIERASIKTQTSLSVLNFGQGAIFTAGLSGMMFMAAGDIVAGTFTVGDLVLVNTLLFQLSMPLNFLGTVYRETKQSLVDMRSLFSLLDEKATIVDSDTAVDLDPSRKPLSVAFDDVTFAYDNGRTILEGLSFEVPAGRSLALVGASGSGKSTVLRLLFRFYEPSRGSIKIGGEDIRGIKIDSLRRAIGVVPQDTVLFNETIAYNVGYGKPGSSDDEIRRAAEHACIDDAISAMPDGYDTVVGERGLKLSGGEKQRVALARVFLKDSPILLCDEATSALDSHTENDVIGALSALANGRTAIFIAHRLSTAARCDNIAVVHDGKIAEMGSHDDLLKKNGMYAAMWDAQSKDSENEGGSVPIVDEAGMNDSFEVNTAGSVR